MKKGTVVGQTKAIRKLHFQGLSVSGIARLAGVATTAISQVLEREGLRKIAKQRPRNFDLEKKIAQAYAAGELPVALAERFSVSEWKVRDCVRREGVTVRGRGQQIRVFAENDGVRIEELWRSGLSQPDIARLFNSSQSTVSRVLRMRGVEIKPHVARGERHGSWRGGRSVNGMGYVSVELRADDPLACMRNVSGYVPEHRLVMARKLKRPLRKNETVHHIDGDKKNNKLSNLQLRQGRHGKHECHVCIDCGSRNIGNAPI